MKEWSRIACIGMIALGCIVISAGWMPKNHQSTTSVLTMRDQDSAKADVQVTDMQLMGQLGTAMELQVVAEHAAFSTAGQRVIMQQVNAKIVQDTVDVWHVTAASGLINRQTGDLTVEGDVRLQEQNGYTIETDKLHWHTAKHVLYTDKPVTMHSLAVSITGTGLRNEVNQHRIILQHNVKATFRYADDRREDATRPALDTPSSDHRERSAMDKRIWGESTSGAFLGD